MVELSVVCPSCGGRVECEVDQHQYPFRLACPCGASFSLADEEDGWDGSPFDDPFADGDEEIE